MRCAIETRPERVPRRLLTGWFSRLAGGLLLAIAMAGPAAATCSSRDLSGAWHRADAAAVWRFAGDGSLICEGDCATSAGVPLAYALQVPQTRLILQDLFGMRFEYARILFSKGAVSFGCTRIGDGLQLSSWDQGPLVFRRAR